jgi:hypothetical protein
MLLRTPSRDRGITDALTADHHFEHARFVALLKEAIVVGTPGGFPVLNR